MSTRKTTDRPTKHLPSAPRQKALRERGRAVSTVLQDPVAIAALEALTEAYGSQRIAIEQALIRVCRITRR